MSLYETRKFVRSYTCCSLFLKGQSVGLGRGQRKGEFRDAAPDRQQVLGTPHISYIIQRIRDSLPAEQQNLITSSRASSESIISLIIK